MFRKRCDAIPETSLYKSILSSYLFIYLFIYLLYLDPFWDTMSALLYTGRLILVAFKIQNC